jgi:xylulose-5-phosphate/fructose-6-phosphate phosphoketolase
VADHCFRSRDYVNLIVIDKQPQLQWLDMETAIEHCTHGASIWHWASNEQGDEPDVVLGCAGSCPHPLLPNRTGACYCSLARQ